MFSKLFALFPVPQGETSELRMRAYIDETMDLPAIWISRALARLRRQEREFVPALGEVRAEVCRLIEDARPRYKNAASAEERAAGAKRLDEIVSGLGGKWKM
jgi:hypothetical protein